MPKSAPGNSRGPIVARPGGLGARGFTLVELLIVVAIVAIAAGLVSLSIRDPATSRLEHEAARLAALLESARAEARASGLAVRWIPGRSADGADAGKAGEPDTSGERAPDFRFVGLPAALGLPQRWIEPKVSAEVIGARAVVLGPEPLIGAQRIVLRLDERRITLATDGLAPFATVVDSTP